MRTATASNSDGSVVVQATATGLPVAVSLSPAVLRGGERAVAAAVLAISAEAGRSAAAADRAVLQARGVPTKTLDALGMPRQRDLPDDDGEPESWLRTR